MTSASSGSVSGRGSGEAMQKLRQDKGFSP
jgi:hypothetical protein